jgi:peptidoglycan/xylan/chitin deacetylase (PgdA/CDA1 family)
MLPVLMYHSVSTVLSGRLRSLAVPPALLADQLVALREAGFTLLGLTEALRRHDADPIGERLVALTFDDGYRDFLTGGLTALRVADAGATLYIAPGHLGGKATWLRSRAGQLGPLLDWSDLPEIVAAGIEIGNHNMIHVPIDVPPVPEVVRTVRDARWLLEDRAGVPVRSFAYPHGHHDRPVRTVVARAGHTSACEVGLRRYSGVGRRYAIPRLWITPDHSPAELVELVAHGEPRLVPALRRLIEPAWRVVRRGAARVGVALT